MIRHELTARARQDLRYYARIEKKAIMVVDAIALSGHISLFTGVQETWFGEKAPHYYTRVIYVWHPHEEAM
jgi:hypothetical protein